jgi:oxalate decarboxylase/phosphoglucose isomerase-like protein (cupin superfamily)
LAFAATGLANSQTYAASKDGRAEAGAMHEPHRHAQANEWHYVAKGKVRVALFAMDKRLATAEISPTSLRAALSRESGFVR